jgi:hypothetical protein
MNFEIQLSNNGKIFHRHPCIIANEGNFQEEINRAIIAARQGGYGFSFSVEIKIVKVQPKELSPHESPTQPAE